ncbi:MAG: chloride channel protein [Deltaproteobacteria bacterium]|nr:MAG: chloride channel protein [Deltaproteobacteria bacterium]
MVHTQKMRLRSLFFHPEFDARRVTVASKWMLYYLLIGLIAGLGSVAFHYLCQSGSHLFMDLMAGYRPPHPAGEGPLFPPTDTPFSRWMLLFVPAIGGLMSGWLVYTFAPEAEGHGTDAAIDAYHNKGGFVRARIPFIKTIASALTISSGGSGGREGPIAQIGAGFGSFLATKLKLSDRERRVMLAAGIGAGVGSIFRAPLAGALFGAEVLYRDPEFESEVLIPSGISSVVAYCVFCLFFGWGSLFESQDFVFDNPLELGPYMVLAFVLVAGGILYIKSFYGIQRLSKRVPVPNHLKPAIGGLLTGAIGFFLPQTLSFGYGFAQMALDNQLPTLFLLALAMGKIATTSLSIGSGGSGGVFGPSIVIGGALGGAVGRVFHALMPGIVTQPGAFVVVGMAGFFAAVSNTPISTIIFVSEMTNSYHLLLPSMSVCSVAFLLSRRWTIYVKQVKSKIDSNAHRGDFFVDVLGAIRVRELLPHVRKVRLIPEDMPLKQFREVFRESQQHYFPVVNEEKKLTGIFSINDIRNVIFDKDIGELVRMKDVANPEIIYTTPSEDLNEVLKKFTVRNLHRLPVVKDEDPAVLLGMLDRREVIEFYNQRVQETKSGDTEARGRYAGENARFKRIRVKDAMRKSIASVRADMRLEELKELVYQGKFNSFPVVDRNGRLCGILSISDCRAALGKGDMTATAGDIATRDVVTVNPEDSFLSALAKITGPDYAILPVVDRKDPRKLVGVLSRGDILRAFHHAVQE